MPPDDEWEELPPELERFSGCGLSSGWSEPRAKAEEAIARLEANTTAVERVAKFFMMIIQVKNGKGSQGLPVMRTHRLVMPSVVHRCLLGKQNFRCSRVNYLYRPNGSNGRLKFLFQPIVHELRSPFWLPKYSDVVPERAAEIADGLTAERHWPSLHVSSSSS